MAHYHEDIVKERKLRENVKNNDAFMTVTKALGIQGTPEYNKLVDHIVQDATEGKSECAMDISGLKVETKPKLVQVPNKHPISDIVPCIYCVVSMKDECLTHTKYVDVIMRIPMDIIKDIKTFKKETFSIYTIDDVKVVTITGWPIWTNYEQIPFEELHTYNVKVVLNYGDSLAMDEY